MFAKKYLTNWAWPIGAAGLVMIIYPAIVQSEPYASSDRLSNNNAQTSISLRDALAQTMLRSPELQAFAYEVRAREAAALQAGLLPNPEFQTELENFAGSGTRSGTDNAETTIRLGQLLEMGGKREKRQQVGEYSRDVASFEMEAGRLEVLGETAKRFIDALTLQERLVLTDELLRSARKSVDIVQAQVRAGAATEVESLRTEVEVGQLESARYRLEEELRGARTLLAAQWGALEPTFTRLKGDLFTIDAPPPLAERIDTAHRSPGIKRFDAEVLEKQAALSLEQSKAVPDITVGIGGRHFSDDDSDALVAELSVPLPVFDRNHGAIQEATERLKKSRVAKEQAVVASVTEIHAAHANMSGAFGEAKRLRERVIPKAEAALSGARSGYELGVSRALDVLDAQRTLFQVREQYIESLRIYHRASAEVDRLSGGSQLDLEQLNAGEYP